MSGNVDVRAVCPGCGPMFVAASEFRCEVGSGRDGICELTCPVCSSTVLVRAVGPAIETLWTAGAGRIRGITPFELLERHDGPPLTWDDVLDFKLALDNACFVPPEGAA